MNVESSPRPLGRWNAAASSNSTRRRTLAKILRERGALSSAHAVDVALDICDALATAHENGVVHGQLGLACVRLVFTPERGPCELEIFTLAAEDDSGVAGVVAPFQAPEQGHGRPNDARDDVWALGALLYTMLVGAPPSTGTFEAPPEGVPMSLAAIIEACLAVSPSDRPQTVDEIAERIASFATSPPDRFACLAVRRERRERRVRVQRNLELRGLSEMPSVLDKLDDAALARAQRDTRTITSLAVGTTTEAALERLMTAVHEGTDSARVELASGLPALVDFDDEDRVVMPTVAPEETEPLAPVASPLATAHVVLPEPPPPAQPEATAPRRNRRTLSLAAASLAAIVSCVALGYVGYSLSAQAPSERSTAAMSANAPPAAATTAHEPAVATPAIATPAIVATPEPAIPVFEPSALPDSPPVTPASLPEAR